MQHLFEQQLQHIFNNKLDSIELVLDGVNKNFKVSIANKPFFIRLSPSSLHTYTDIETEIRVLTAANAAAVPCCQPIALAGNAIIGPIMTPAGQYYGLCNSYVTGRCLQDNANDFRLFGRTLGLLHNVDVSAETMSPASVNKIPADNFGFNEEKVREFASIARELDTRFESNKRKALSDKLPNEFGLCHGDAWIGNAMLETDTVTLFDFENSFFGSTAFDIATLLCSLLDFNESKKYELFSAFLQGYQSVCNKRYNADFLYANIVFNEVRRLLLH